MDYLGMASKVTRPTIAGLFLVAVCKELYLPVYDF
jgi:hypothetical protein